MIQGTRDRPQGAGAPGGDAPYEPPRVERLGSLRDLLAVKTGPGTDPSPILPFAKK